MLLFRVKKGKDNYAKCDGCYKPDPKGRHLNGHLVYQNEGQHRFLAKTDDAWVIGPVQDLEGHLQEQRNLAFLLHFCIFFGPSFVHASSRFGTWTLFFLQVAERELEEELLEGFILLPI